MEKLLQEMGTRIAARRKQLNMTQAALAEAVGVTTQTISSAECGRKALRPENIVKLSVALNCSTDYLLTGTETPGVLDTMNRVFKNLTPLQYQCLNSIIDNFLLALNSEDN